MDDPLTWRRGAVAQVSLANERARGNDRRPLLLCKNPPRQGRKAATARDRGLSALLSSAPTGVDRPLPFFTSFPFNPRFCLDRFTHSLCSGTPSAIRCFMDDRMRANTKRHYYTK